MIILTDVMYVIQRSKLFHLSIKSFFGSISVFEWRVSKGGAIRMMGRNIFEFFQVVQIVNI